MRNLGPSENQATSPLDNQGVTPQHFCSSTDFPHGLLVSIYSVASGHIKKHHDSRGSILSIVLKEPMTKSKVQMH